MPCQGIILTVVAVVCACYAAEQSVIKPRRTRQLIDTVPYDQNEATVLNGYFQGHADVDAYHSLLDQNYDTGFVELPQQNLYDGYHQYQIEDIKRYAVKEDVDEGYVTTTRPVYLPRMTTRAPPRSDNGWQPLVTNTPRPASGKSIFIPSVSNFQQNTNQIQYSSYPQGPVKTTFVPVEKVVGYPVPQPYTVPVYQPYPVAVPQPYPVSVPLPVQVHSTVAVPVEKPVPVPVVKHVPYNVIKNEPVPVPLPYPVPVPLYKTKYVVHTNTK